MKISRRVALSCAVFVFESHALAQVELVPCGAHPKPAPAPLAASAAVTASSVLPLVGKPGAPAPTALVGDFVPFRIALSKPSAPLQQIDVGNTVPQLRSAAGAVPYTSQELTRQVASSKCDQALRSLAGVLEAQRDQMGYPPREEAGLAEFADWYLGGGATSDQKKAAEPVVVAQREFERECMAAAIPSELNATLVRQAVGLLAVDEEPICTALRVKSDRIVTAKHCFLQARDGKASPSTTRVLAGNARLWFAYEAEPKRRFEVCASSLPAPQSAGIQPDADNIELVIADTSAPVTPLKWIVPPLAGGTSLYVRGFFPFAAGGSPLERMRATAHGGCAAMAVRGRCIYHGCQTLSGMSGAPIFVRPDTPALQTELVVAGIHVGPARLATASLCSVSGSDVYMSNLGYLPKGN